MPGDIGDDGVELIVVAGQDVEVVTADLPGRHTETGDVVAGDIREGGGEQPELDRLGNLQLAFVLPCRDQLVGLFGVSPRHADLPGEVVEKFDELLGEYSLGDFRERRQHPDRLAFDRNRRVGQGDDPLAPGDFGGNRLVHERGVVDDDFLVGQKRLADAGRHVEVALRFAIMFRGHALLAFDHQGLGLGVEDADNAEIELELLLQQGQDAVEDILELVAAGDDPGRFVQDAQLFATGRAAQGDRAEDVEDVLHGAAAGLQVVFDDDLRRGRADRAGQGHLGKLLEGRQLVFG